MKKHQTAWTVTHKQNNADLKQHDWKSADLATMPTLWSLRINQSVASWNPIFQTYAVIMMQLRLNTPYFCWYFVRNRFLLQMRAVALWCDFSASLWGVLMNSFLGFSMQRKRKTQSWKFKSYWPDFFFQIKSNLENSSFREWKGLWYQISLRNPVMALIWITLSESVV